MFLQDVLESDEPVEALWGMLTDAEVSLNGQTAELTKNGWTVSAEIISPRHAVFDVISAAAPAPQAANPGVKKLVASPAAFHSMAKARGSYCQATW